jgi:hypothetical protein
MACPDKAQILIIYFFSKLASVLPPTITKSLHISLAD